MQALIIVEHNNHEMSTATRHVVSAALAMNIHPVLLVIGFNCEEVATNAARINGVKEVLLANHACYAQHLAENSSLLIVELSNNFTHILAPANSFGKDLLPRVAALLDVTAVSEVTKIIDHQTFEHPIYAGNAIEVVKVLDDKKLLTIRTIAFQMTPFVDFACKITQVNIVHEIKNKHLMDSTSNTSERPSLQKSKIIVSGGRGLQSAEKFSLIESLADRLGAAIGASRAAVDAGFIDNMHQVGQTGHIVAPDLYIAIGISGAVQHVAGMKDSKIIVAINQDEHAPIFQIADYGLVGDLFDIVPQLMEVLS